MLMITYEKTAQGIVLKLEGRVAGEWVNELEDFWRRTAARIGSTKLLIDICDVTYADFQGIEVLRRIYSQSQGELVANSPWNRHLAEEIREIRQDATVEEQVADYKGQFESLLKLPGKFFSKVTPEEFNTLMWMAFPMTCPSGEVLFRENDSLMNSVYVVLTGKVKLSVNSPENKQLMYSIAKEGDILGLDSVLSSGPSQITAETLGRATLARIWKGDFLNFLSNYPAVNDAVLQEMGENARPARQAAPGTEHAQGEQEAEVLQAVGGRKPVPGRPGELR